uniref:serine-protein kinase ATM-like isoform X2 n=1 Tax=Ciona intestinalis TaxID=7719 RepID=UPI000EF4BE61|nr:serine-protein kinase ATM-like isoform X2 [Ciona intestinalis]|eukprot:XP_026692971.1 serine-protein kinase ATM-like isoform X2 [Ciona intestinalis]
MSYLLDQLRNSCHCLECDKVTDRKKNADNIKRLIQHPEVVQQLNELWARPGKTKLSYTIVFMAIHGYIFKESELLNHKVQNLTPSMRKTKLQKLKEISGLLRLVVKTACKDGPKIKSQEFLDAVFVILRHDFQKVHLGGTYLHLLVHELLTSRVQISHVTPQQWKDILFICCSSFENGDFYGVGVVRAMQIIKSLLLCVLMQCQISNFEFLFSFFNNCIKKKSQCSGTVLEPTLTCMLEFCKTKVCSNTHEVLLLGKATLPMLVGLLSSKATTDVAKTKILEFSLFQIQALNHYSLVGDTYYWTDNHQWGELLKNLLFHTETFICSNKHNADQFPNCKGTDVAVELSSVILIHFFSMKQQHKSSIMIFQPSCIVDLVKQRIETQSLSNAQWWLKVLQTLLQKPDIFTQKDLLHFTYALYELLTRKISNEVTTDVLTCLCYMCVWKPTNEQSDNYLFKIWRKVFEITRQFASSLVTLKNLSLSNSAFTLMSSVLQNDQEHKFKILGNTPNLLNSLWPVIYMSQRPTRGFLLFLCTWIKIHGLEEIADSSLVTQLKKEQCNSFQIKQCMPIRCGILDWLLQFLNSKTQDSSLLLKDSAASDATAMNSSDFDVKIASILLIALCCEDPRACLQRFLAKSFEFSLVSVEFETPEGAFWFTTAASKFSGSFWEKKVSAEIPTLVYEDVPEVLPCKYFHDALSKHIANNTQDLATLQLNEPNIEIIKKNLTTLNLLVYLSMKWPFHDWEKNLEKVSTVLSAISDQLKRLQLSYKDSTHNNAVYGALTAILDGLLSANTVISQTSNSRKQKILEFLLKKLDSVHEVTLEIFRISVFSGRFDADAGNGSSSNCEDFGRMGSEDLEGSFSQHPNPPPEGRREHAAIEILYEDAKGRNGASTTTESTPSRKELARVSTKLIVGIERLLKLNKWTDMLDIFNDDQFKIADDTKATSLVYFMKHLGSCIGHSFTESAAKSLIKLMRSLFRCHYQDQLLCAACLEALSRIIAKFPFSQESGNILCHHDVVSLLQIIQKLISKETCGAEVKIGYIMCLSALFNTYTSQENNFEDPGSLQSKFGVSCSIIEFLADGNSAVRFCCIYHLRNLFKPVQSGNNAYEKLQFHKELLTQICKVGRFCDFRKKPSQTTAQKVAEYNIQKLHFLNTYVLALCSVVCHKSYNLDQQVIMEICNATRGFEHLENDREIFGKFIEISCSVTKFFTLENCGPLGTKLKIYISKFLPYILSQWCQHRENTWKMFPYFLFGCHTMSEFTKTHYSSFIPVLVAESSGKKDKMAAVLKYYDNVKVVQSCLASILPFVVVNVAAKSSKTSQIFLKIEKQKCIEIIQWLASVSEYNSKSQMVLHNLPIVLHNLFLMYHPLCEDHDTDLCCMSNTDPNPFAFAGIDETHLEACLCTLLQLCNAQYNTDGQSWKPALISLLVESSNFHTVLLSMQEEISSAVNVVEQKRALLAYRYFCLFVVENLELLGEMQNFFLRSTICIFFHHAIEVSEMVKSPGKTSHLCYPTLACICINTCFNVYTAVSQLGSLNCIEILASRPVVHIALLALFSISNACDMDRDNINLSVSELYLFLMENNKMQTAYQPALHAYPVSTRNTLYARIQNSNITNTPVLPYENSNITKTEILQILLQSIEDSIIMDGLGYYIDNLQEGILLQTIETLQDMNKNERKRNQILLKSQFNKSLKFSFENSKIKVLIGKFIGLVGSEICEDTELEQQQQENSCFTALLNELCTLVFHTHLPTAKAAVDSTIKLVKIKHIQKSLSSIPQHKRTLEVLKGFNIKTKTEETATQCDKSLLNNQQLWSCRHKNFKTWITELTTAMLLACEIQHLHALVGICRLSPTLCSHVLPHTILQVLLYDQAMKDVLSNGIMASLNSAFEENNLPLNHSSLHTILLTLQYLRENGTCNTANFAQQSSNRNQPKVFGPNSLSYLLDINLLTAAKVSLICGSSYQAILYTESWADSVEDSMYKSAQQSNGNSDRVKFPRGSTSRTTSAHISSTTTSNPVSNIVNFLDAEKRKSLIQFRQLGKCCALDVMQELGKQGKDAISILTEAYNFIGDVDGLYGVIVSPVHGSQDAPLLNMYEKEGCWDKLLKSHDLLLSIPGGSKSNMGEVVASLQNCSLSHVCDMYMRGISKDHTAFASDELLQDLQYKSVWTAGQWDVASLHGVHGMHGAAKTSFHKHMFHAMHAMHNNCPLKFTLALENGRTHAVLKLLGEPLKSVSSNLEPVVSRLQCLSEMEEIERILRNTGDLQQAVNTWVSNPVFPGSYSKFEDVDLVMSCRTTLFSLLLSRSENEENSLHESYLQHLLNCVKISCHYKQLQHAKKVLVKLKTATQMCVNETSMVGWPFKIHLEEAKLLWEEQDQVFALAMLQNLKRQLNPCAIVDDHVTLVHAETLRVLGTWLHELHFVGPSEILEEYLYKALKMSENLMNSLSNDKLQGGTTREIVAACFTLAKFADQQYLQITKYKLSNEYAQKKALAEAPTQEMLSMKKMGEQLSRKTQILVSKNSNLDLKELTRIEDKEEKFLKCALETYIKCLKMSDEHDTLMNRICSLWFSNNLLAITNDIISDGHSSLPSYKYIPLAYQLAARLKTPTNDSYFQNMLQEILLRVTVDHPYHTLFVILALTHAHKDEEKYAPPPSKRTKSERNKKNTVTTSTITAALNLLAKVERVKPDLVSATKLLSLLYIEFANFDASPWKNQPGQKISLPKSLPFYKLCERNSKLSLKIQQVNLPTTYTPVDKTAIYDDSVGMSDSKFQPYSKPVVA